MVYAQKRIRPKNDNRQILWDTNGSPNHNLKTR